MNEAKNGQFGHIYKQFKGQPKKAIRFLKRKKTGECLAVLHRDDIGDIDLVWGEVTDPEKHKGYGLAHIIDKHEQEINQLGFKIEDFVPIVVQFGSINVKKTDSQKIVFESNGFRFVIAIQKKPDGSTKQWLLTAFNLTKRPK